MAPLSRTLLLALLFLSSLLKANSETIWNLVSHKDLGKIPPSALLRSFSLENGTEEQVEINALIFQEKDFSLIVMDHPLQNKSLLEAVEKSSCIAGVNGGYFQLDGTPLGLLVHKGKTIHPLQHAGILSGLFVNTPHRMSLLRVGESIPNDATEVLQAGPFLLDHAHPVIGLESTKKAYRTFLATNEQGLWMIGIISPVTLAEAAQILFSLNTSAIPGPAPIFHTDSAAACEHLIDTVSASNCSSDSMKHTAVVAIHHLPCHHQDSRRLATNQHEISGLTTKFITRALNLDGGSSSALWADTKPAPFSFRADVCVRDFLGLKVKKELYPDISY
ncbi:MAG: phosphodiester glycosidase family protein [Chthoniobacterales bacterium]|nr:phosphodiester glycosidase family protein [Chthoniobacterales bacterium]